MSQNFHDRRTYHCQAPVISSSIMASPDLNIVMRAMPYAERKKKIERKEVVWIRGHHGIVFLLFIFGSSVSFSSCHHCGWPRVAAIRYLPPNHIQLQPQTQSHSPWDITLLRRPQPTHCTYMWRSSVSAAFTALCIFVDFFIGKGASVRDEHDVWSTTDSVSYGAR